MLSPIDRQIHYLYCLDQKHTPGAPMQLAQIGKKTAKLLMQKAAEAPNGTYLELGTSAGLSALHILKAIMPKQQHLHTVEQSEKKFQLAEESFRHAEVNDHVTLIKGNAVEQLKHFSDIAFCFVDCKKDLYHELYDLLIPKLVLGGIVIFDDVLSFEDETFDQKIIGDKRITPSKVRAENGQWILTRSHRYQE